MDPIEVNAGGFYLRSLRIDERIDDSVATGDILGLDRDAATRRIDEFTRGWADETELSWAVCEQTDVTCLAIITYDVGGDTLDIAAAPGDRGRDPRETYAGPFAAIERFVATYRQGG